MNRTQIAGYMLLASAFVLSALLCITAARHMPAAQANQTISKGSYSVLTARARQGNDESLVILDHQNQRIVVYLTEIRGSSRSRLEPTIVRDISRIFDAPVSNASRSRTEPEAERPAR